MLHIRADLIDMRDKLMNMLNLLIDVLKLPTKVLDLLIHMLVAFSAICCPVTFQ